MDLETHRGNVLVIADDESVADRLCRWVAAAGELPLPLCGADKYQFEAGSDDRVDLVVTKLDLDQPPARRLFDRLLDGELFFGAPQLHLLASDELRRRVHEVNPDSGSTAMKLPVSEEDFANRVRLGAELGRSRRDLSRTAVRDDLTGVFNRRFLVMRIDQEFARARRHHTPLSVVLLDIDDLKEINERHGLDVGDRAVLQASRVLRGNVRREDVYGRWSGGAFLTILPGTRYRGAAVFANKVRGDAEALEIKLDDSTLPVRVSAGISSMHPGPSIRSAADLMQAAEQALAQAKARGGNRVFIDETALRAERKLVLIADPDPALLDMAEDLLAMDDYRVIRAESLETLFETVKYRQPDLMIIDLELARHDGHLALIERLRGAHGEQHAPIIVLSREPAPELPHLARLGVDFYFTKPFSIGALRSVARDLLQSGARARAAKSTV